MEKWETTSIIPSWLHTDTERWHEYIEIRRQQWFDGLAKAGYQLVGFPTTSVCVRKPVQMNPLEHEREYTFYTITGDVEVAP